MFFFSGKTMFSNVHVYLSLNQQCQSSDGNKAGPGCLLHIMMKIIFYHVCLLIRFCIWANRNAVPKALGFCLAGL